MKVITTRIEEKYFKDLRKIEKEEHAERAEVTRKLLANAIKQWKIKKALELLKEHKATIRKAASFAEISYVEMLDIASKENVGIGYTINDLRKDLER